MRPRLQSHPRLFDIATYDSRDSRRSAASCGFPPLGPDGRREPRCPVRSHRHGWSVFAVHILQHAWSPEPWTPSAAPALPVGDRVPDPHRVPSVGCHRRPYSSRYLLTAPSDLVCSPGGAATPGYGGPSPTVGAIVRYNRGAFTGSSRRSVTLARPSPRDPSPAVPSPGGHRSAEPGPLCHHFWVEVTSSSR